MELMGTRDQCCRWYESKESRRDTSRKTSIRQSWRRYQRDGSNCVCDLRPVRNLVIFDHTLCTKDKTTIITDYIAAHH